MSLEAVLAAIRQQGDTEARDIEQRAQMEVARILAEAERERELSQQAAERHALATARAERARILQAASLEALQIMGSAQQNLVDRVLAQLRTRLSQLRSSPEYPAVLRRLLVEGMEVMAGSLGDGDTVQLFVDPRDRDLLGPMLAALPMACVPRYELDTWGGVLVTGADGRVSVDNTLETRLEEATGYFRRVLPALFQPDTSEQRED